MGTFHSVNSVRNTFQLGRLTKASGVQSSLLALCILLAGVFMFSFCTRETDLKPVGRGTLVVECILSQEPVQTLRLTLTDIAPENDWKALENAKVMLTDIDEGVVRQFRYVGNSLWSLDYSAEPQYQYLLEIDVEGHDRVSAKTKMPSSLSIKYTIMTRANPDIVTLHPDDEPSSFFEGFPDFEQGIRFEIGSLPSGPVWVCGRSYDESSGLSYFAQEIATSLQNADPFNLTGREYWNPFNHKADSLYEHNYDYPGSNGLIGGGSPYYHYPKQYRPTMYKYVVGQAIHDRFLRIPSEEEGGVRTAPDPKEYFSVSGSFTPDYDYWTFTDMGVFLMPDDQSITWTPRDSYLLFSSFSPEYDRYLKECLIEKATIESVSDFASLFNQKSAYSNVENGVGIFGARTDQKLPWNKYSHAYGYSSQWY